MLTFPVDGSTDVLKKTFASICFSSSEPFSDLIIVYNRKNNIKYYKIMMKGIIIAVEVYLKCKLENGAHVFVLL